MYSTQILPSASTTHAYKFLKPVLLSSGKAFSMLLPYVWTLHHEISMECQHQMSKRVIICVIKANVKKSPSMSHCYHSVIHLHRNDSRDRFSHRGKKLCCITVGMQHIPHSHMSSLHLLVLSFCSQVLHLV